MQEPQSLSDVKHLIARFFGHVLAKPPTTDEATIVNTFLSERERILWWRQSVGDQRHALLAAHHVLSQIPENRSAVRAALLHDLGKRHCRLGAIGRSLATVIGALGLPQRGRFQTYLDHGKLGAAELETLGAEPIVVDFARLHTEGMPPGVDEALWSVLFAADRTTKRPDRGVTGNTMSGS
ncbi:MAG: HDIG domain-containing protein [Acidimicrobiia bacterium]|nr:HDIG domain-containing protein [Acidimicrobiia bacterium]NNF64694.1 HDIG domain-containing protein [Acidimicrobiia bacterium]